MREHATPQEAESAPGCDVPVTAAEVLLEGHRATRDRVARSILDHGPSSAADLATRLGLTAAAVRRHLDGLAAAGLVESREQRVYGSRGRGRPAKVFALTDGGRDAFYQAYDQLAADALRWISDSVGGGKAGEEAVAAFARARFGKQGERYLEAPAAGRGGGAHRGARPGAERGRVRCHGAAGPAGRGEGPGRRPALPAPLPGRAHRRAVPAALRGGDRGLLPAAGHPCATAGHHRPRRRGLHHLCAGTRCRIVACPAFRGRGSDAVPTAGTSTEDSASAR